MLPAAFDISRCFRDLPGYFRRDGLNAVAVSANQVTRANLQASYCDAATEIEEMGICVRNCVIEGRFLKTQWILQSANPVLGRRTRKVSMALASTHVLSLRNGSRSTWARTAGECGSQS